MIPKKVWYVPGLISLLGLPILLLLFGPEDKVQQTALKFYLPSDDIYISDSIYTKGNVFNNIKNHKIIEIDLWDKLDYLNENREVYLNNKKLRLIQNEMERLQFTHDTTTVLKVELSEGDTYGEFVWLINQATIYRLKHYSFVDDDFYFFANDPPIDYSKIPHEPFYIDSTAMIINSSYKPPTAWDIFRWKMDYIFEEWSYYMQQNKLLSIAFVILIFFPSLSRLIKRKRISNVSPNVS